MKTIKIVKDGKVIEMVVYEYDTDIVDEVCPWCDTEVELKDKMIPQLCPECSIAILPCSMCVPDRQSCNECPYDAKGQQYTVELLIARAEKIANGEEEGV